MPRQLAPSLPPPVVAPEPGSTVAPDAGVTDAAPAGKARRGRLLRAEIAARLAAPPPGGAALALAGILEQVARQLATRGGPPVG